MALAWCFGTRPSAPGPSAPISGGRGSPIGAHKSVACALCFGLDDPRVQPLWRAPRRGRPVALHTLQLLRANQPNERLQDAAPGHATRLGTSSAVAPAAPVLGPRRPAASLQEGERRHRLHHFRLGHAPTDHRGGGGLHDLGGGAAQRPPPAWPMTPRPRATKKRYGTGPRRSGAGAAIASRSAA
jgi:hypothetical protein